MIVLDDKTIVEEDRELLKQDLTGYNLILHFTSQEVLKEHSSFGCNALEQYPRAWKESTDRQPMLLAYCLQWPSLPKNKLCTTS